MGNFSKSYSITDASGSTPTIARGDSEELIIRVETGSNRIFLAFNEPAVDGFGMYMDAGDTFIITGKKADSDVYMVCATGETATVYGQIAP